MEPNENWRSEYPWQDQYLDEEHSTIIECLGHDGERVLDIKLTPNGVRFSTRQGGQNGTTLSKTHLDRFIAELTELSEKLGDRSA